MPRGVRNATSPTRPSINALLAAAEQTAIDLALTKLEIDTIERAVQIGHFTFLGGRSAKSASDFPDRIKHFLVSSSVYVFDKQKIGPARVNYHRRNKETAMH
ncbi:hypothetical protein ABID08_001717 [Rhizobium binae]|uniref:Uncharacterized protein n=1 Tax=Rhizobium binae TaxID=1138190 RepID=A0ABV2MD32_9HYPH